MSAGVRYAAERRRPPRPGVSLPDLERSKTMQLTERRKCAEPRCGRLFIPKSSRHRYCIEQGCRPRSRHGYGPGLRSALAAASRSILASRGISASLTKPVRERLARGRELSLARSEASRAASPAVVSRQQPGRRSARFERGMTSSHRAGVGHGRCRRWGRTGHDWVNSGAERPDQAHGCQNLRHPAPHDRRRRMAGPAAGSAAEPRATEPSAASP